MRKPALPGTRGLGVADGAFVAADRGMDGTAAGVGASAMEDADVAKRSAQSTAFAGPVDDASCALVTVSKTESSRTTPGATPATAAIAHRRVPPTVTSSARMAGIPATEKEIGRRAGAIGARVPDTRGDFEAELSGREFVAVSVGFALIVPPGIDGVAVADRVRDSVFAALADDVAEGADETVADIVRHAVAVRLREPMSIAVTSADALAENVVAALGDAKEALGDIEAKDAVNDTVTVGETEDVAENVIWGELLPDPVLLAEAERNGELDPVAELDRESVACDDWKDERETVPDRLGEDDEEALPVDDVV